MSNNHCILCGTIIPEGRIVCSNCENKEPKKFERKLIYVITTFEKIDANTHGFPYYGSIRSVAWYSNYKDAFEAVTNNHCDIWECGYNYAVIETLPEGMYPTTCNGYKAEYFKYSSFQRKYLPIDASEVKIHNDLLQTWSIG